MLTVAISANYKSTLAATTNLRPDARLRANVFACEHAAANVCMYANAAAQRTGVACLS